MPKVKSALKSSVQQSAKNRLLVSKDGQLRLQNSPESTETTRLLTNHADDSQSDDESNNLASILKELSSTVKKLEKKLDTIHKDSKKNDDKVSAFEVVQQQETVKLRGVIDQLDDHDDKIQALIGIVVKQDQQIQTLTNQVNLNYAARNQKNIIINGMSETQGENCIHEVAHFVKHVLKIDKGVQLKFARRMGKGQNRPMLLRLKNPADKAVFFQNFDKIKKANEGRERPFFITDQIPEAWAE